MKLFIGLIYITFIFSVCGCSNHTTDPSEGGLIGYNPKAYEKRLEERQQRLSKLEEATSDAEQKSIELEKTKQLTIQQKIELEEKVAELSESINNLDIKIKSAQATTSEQIGVRNRALKEVDQLDLQLKLADDLEDPAQKKEEIERLIKQRDSLEKEIEALTLL